MDISLLLFLILIAVPASTLIHEIGHALAANIFHAKTINLSIGKGKILREIRFKNMVMTIHAVFFLEGHTSSSRSNPYSKKELLWITALGPFFNVMTAFLLFFVHNAFPNSYLFLLFLYNVWLGIGNLIPFKYNNKNTDGYTLYKLLLGKC